MLHCDTFGAIMRQCEKRVSLGPHRMRLLAKVAYRMVRGAFR
jgi:hypothetical protein